MAILHLCAPLPACPIITFSKHLLHNNFAPSSTVALKGPSYTGTLRFLCTVKNPHKNVNSDEGEFSAEGMYARREAKDFDQEDEDHDEAGFSGQGPYTGREEKDFDRDPEFAEIIGSCLDDPEKARSKVRKMT